MRDIETSTYYELLGVEPDASVEQIKEAYREIARIYHPDSNFYSDIVGDNEIEDDSAVFKSITNAYQVLINADKRQAYDALFPKNLQTWGDEDDGLKPDSGFSAASQTQASQAVPEEWRKEREYFEEHYQEILKPAPRADLVGIPDIKDAEGRNASVDVWEETSPYTAGTRFGEISVDADIPPGLIASPTRRVVKPRYTFGPDPWWALMFIGIPALLALVLVELYLFM